MLRAVCSYFQRPRGKNLVLSICCTQTLPFSVQIPLRPVRDLQIFAWVFVWPVFTHRSSVISVGPCPSCSSLLAVDVSVCELNVFTPHPSVSSRCDSSSYPSFQTLIPSPSPVCASSLGSAAPSNTFHVEVPPSPVPSCPPAGCNSTEEL